MWYASLENLKAIHGPGWTWLTKLKANRLVDPERIGPRRLDEVAIPAAGAAVHLKGYGLVRVLATVARDGDIEYWASNDLGMDEPARPAAAERCRAIEDYHRGLKPHCNAERARRDHVGLAIRALLRLEWHRYTTGVGWAEAKARIIREAVRKYVEKPLYVLPGTV